MIYDISMDISENMMVYKNKLDKYPTIKQVNTFERDGNYESELTMNLHTGTHIDYPLHMIENGENSNTENLSILTGRAKVFDLTHVSNSIGLSDILGFEILENDFVIFKTRNSLTDVFDYEFIYLDESAAIYLKEKRVRAVGIDALGIERNQLGYPTHKALLGFGIIILEGLRLKAIEAGEYDIYCLPLKIKGVEAVPVRAILVK